MEDLIAFRRQVRMLAQQVGMNLADQARVVMCATELAENVLKHAGGGHCRAELCEVDGRDGVRICCSDDGPGIGEMDWVLHDRPDQRCDLLGGGLVGVRRVADHFSVESGEAGTRVEITCLDGSGVPVVAVGARR